MVGEIISEWWARSNRNGGRDHSGMVGDIERNQHIGLRSVCVDPLFAYDANYLIDNKAGIILDAAGTHANRARHSANTSSVAHRYRWLIPIEVWPHVSATLTAC
jgi:hypothetical protein